VSAAWNIRPYVRVGISDGIKINGLKYEDSIRGTQEKYVL